MASGQGVSLVFSFRRSGSQGSGVLRGAQVLVSVILDFVIVVQDSTYNRPTFFCWLGHLKMSFYYPSSHRGREVVYFLYFNL